MVKSCFRKYLQLTIIVFVVANLSLANFVFAKQLTIKAADVDKIKIVLDMTKTIATVADMILDNKDFLTILNTVIGGGKTATDITYGLVVLSALGEMDLIDLVISQEYKTEAREYFNRVLDERTSLRSYWKGVGVDIPKVLSGYITGPAAALTLNSFAITDKTIAIFIEFNVLQKMKLYDGLWYYFDTRKQGNEPHEVAWAETKEVLGWVAKSSFSFRTINKFQEDRESQLEQQFSALYEKWAPYVTPYGISEEYKKQVKSELSNVLIAAAKENSVLAKEPKTSLIDKLAQQLNKIKEATATLISQINPFKAGPVVNLPKPEPKIEAEPDFNEVQEVEIAENSSPLIKEVPEPREETPAFEEAEETPTPEPELELELEPEPELESELLVESTTTTTPELEEEPTPEPAPTLQLCQKRAGDLAKRYRVLINEVAWMGTANSANDEWIELRNIWGIPVKLSSWQLLDKDKQIKIVFGESDIIPAGGYYLLERTDDNSMPDAKADLIYTGALSNTDEALYLFDDQCDIEDEILANPNWPAGDNLLKKPMERFNDLDWYAGASTPGSENSSPPASYTHPSPAASASPPLVNKPSTSKILITEVQIESSTSNKDDFIELYNPNNQGADISNWQLKKRTSSGSEYSIRVLPENSIIGSYGYFLWANSDYATSSSVSADAVSAETLAKKNSVALFDQDGKIVDVVAWGSSTNPFAEGQSFPNDPGKTKNLGRKWSSTSQDYIDTDNNQNDFELQIPTPKAQNKNSESASVSGADVVSGIIINEIAWAGTRASAFDEWIELYNHTTSSIDIDGWRLSSSDSDGIDITFSTSTATTTTIPAQGFYLIERTDDNAIKNISADWMGAFSGGLSNTSCEILSLYNRNEILIDETACSGKNWPGGEASPRYISMERINPSSGSNPANWASNNLITKNGLDAKNNLVNGTPKAENSVAKSFTAVTGGLIIAEDFILTKLGNPYLIEGPVKVELGAKLTIEPGVTMKFKHNEYWHSEFKVSGELEALGGSAPEQKIVFTSFYDATGTEPKAGDWEWLYFENAKAKLDNVIIKYAGKKEGNPPFSPPFTRGAISVKGGSVEIKNSTIEKSQTLGLWLLDSADVLVDGTEFLDADGDWEKAAAVFIENGKATVKNSTFKNNKIGVWLENGNNSSFENNVFKGNEIPIRTATLLPRFSGNAAQNNNFNGILVNSLGFSDSVSEINWQPDDLPYVIESSATIPSGKTLNIKPGTIVKLKDSGAIYIEGILNAEGAKNKEIVFTSLNDDEHGGDTNNDGAATQPAAGYWDSIYFYASSTNSVLDNVIIRYGGWYNTFWGGAEAKGGAVKVNGATLTIKNAVFENNVYCGLELIGSTSEIKDTVFRGHTADYFWGQRSAGLMIRDSDPIFKKADFHSNYYGIYVHSGECPDLKGATFGSGDEANSVKVFPSNCAPKLTD